MVVIAAAGIGFQVARIWRQGDRAFERQLKRRRNTPKLCPLCQQERRRG